MLLSSLPGERGQDYRWIDARCETRNGRRIWGLEGVKVDGAKMEESGQDARVRPVLVVGPNVEVSGAL